MECLNDSRKPSINDNDISIIICYIDIPINIQKKKTKIDQYNASTWPYRNKKSVWHFSSEIAFNLLLFQLDGQHSSWRRYRANNEFCQTKLRDLNRNFTKQIEFHSISIVGVNSIGIANCHTIGKKQLFDRLILDAIT